MWGQISYGFIITGYEYFHIYSAKSLMLANIKKIHAKDPNRDSRATNTESKTP
jgi:hypothetical protein